ncbi:protein GPR108-like [Corythoichthys intestinalis]|uniref:protein GPR108-like n=1 Tax=Corythoichthys intestinalis TaxID=161448 RepID=UPI0025A62648|nr:protein GPR108-like [Corythoichthys intestinalis]XP_061791760.1 protein GPR108-like [Nerophis lumbriciformis]
MAVAHQGGVVAGLLLLFFLGGCKARIHKLTLKNESRSFVHLNTFGFYANGTLDVNLHSLRLQQQLVNYSLNPVGFTLSRARVSGVLSYTAEETGTCPLTITKVTSNEPLILFLININSPSVNVRVFGTQDSVLTAKLKANVPTKEKGQKSKRQAPEPAPGNSAAGVKDGNKDSATTADKAKAKANTEPVDPKKEDKITEKTTTDIQLGSTKEITLALDKINDTYAFNFHLLLGQLSEGLYNFNFYYCQNMVPGIALPYSFTLEVTEKNPGGFLSAAEIPLSRLYIGMAGVFFGAALLWVYTLMKHRYSVFKIHWLMAALAFTKSTSLVFHSINYHFINTEGHPIEGWAVMYYITHLLKGALLFITLALIGTGWAFVKYILSDKEKKIFMIVIPLQCLANVAYIIIESTEEGSSEYPLWKEILFLVDLICCGAILFPVVWSIRHLQEASSTDGKAAMNLEKLKLFRHYYVMIVCYIYFTRIIAILLKVTMPFQWQWFYEFLVEVSTLIFFVLTGYKFRPASNNPYLQLPQDEEDEEMDEIVTESGALEGISKVKKTSNGRERQKEATL